MPEIQRTALTTAVLHLKSMPLDIDVLHFDFLDAPPVSFPLPLLSPVGVARRKLPTSPSVASTPGLVCPVSSEFYCRRRIRI